MALRATDRLKLLERIGSELQQRYTFTEVDAFFAAVGIRTSGFEHGGSKRIYAKEVLAHASEADVLRVATELDLITNGGPEGVLGTPANWKGIKLFRLFISHISKDKLIATRLKDCLANYAISGFVAHEDIHPTLEWQSEIERALQTMDGFIAVHTKGFSASYWTQQEVGFALGRGAKVISFKMGEDPTGFISKQQALARRSRTAEAIAKEIDQLLAQDRRTSGRLAEAKASVRPRRPAFDLDLDDDVPF
jgi:hypothetical protein